MTSSTALENIDYPKGKLTKTDEAAIRLHMGEDAASISIKYAAL